MTKTLNDRFVAGIRCSTRDNFFDTKARGLALRVSPRAKTWYFTYRNNGPTQWVRLGAYPAVTLAAARVAALEQRHAIDVDGKDPAADRRTRAVVEAMRADEARHRQSAIALGAAELPDGAKRAMRLASKVMTTVAYRV